MATFDKLLVQMLRHGASTEVQHLALTAARKGGKLSAALWQALAGCPTLDPALVPQVATCNASTARATLWARTDLDTEVLLAYLPRERSRVALKALLKALPSRESAHATLRTTMTRAHADALVADGLTHWPVDIVEAAVRCSDGGENLPALAASGHDLSGLVSDPTVHRAVRVAACASTGTPDAVVAAHLADAVRPSPRVDIWRLMPLLGRRAPDPGVLASLRDGLEDTGQCSVTWSSVKEYFADWCAGAVANDQITDRMTGCTTPEQLEELWSRLTLEQQTSHHRHFHEHSLCSANLYRQLRPTCPGPARQWQCWGDENGAALYLRQDVQLLVERVTGKGSFSVLGENACWILDAAADCPWSLPVATLMDTFVDMALADLRAGTFENAAYWAAKLVRHPAFPRDRIAEMPVEVLIAALDYPVDDDDPVRWLVEDLSATLTPFAGREADALPVLTAAVTTGKPMHDLVHATTVSLTAA